jgi:hypothetical protein
MNIILAALLLPLIYAPVWSPVAILVRIILKGIHP